MPDSRPHIRAILKTVLTVAVALFADRASELTASDRSDARARDGIIGTETLAENPAGLRQRVARLEPQRRYAAIADYVLPSEKHESIRFAVTFAPTPHQRTPAVPLDRLQSVVLDLIDAAEQAGKLDELHTRVAALAFDEETEQRQHIALLALVEIARANFPAVLPLLDQIESRHRDREFPELPNRWPETLLLSVAVEHPELHDTVESMMTRIVSSQVRTGRNAGPFFWDMHILSLAGRLKHLQTARRDAGASQTLPPFGTPPPLKQWTPVSDGDEATFAQGFPAAHWQLFDDRIEKLSAHRNEHLYFQSPLHGDYEVECDISGFGWRDGNLAVGGHWLNLHFSHRQFDNVGLRGAYGKVDIKPRLSEVNDWIHYRSVVRDGECHSYINGRLLLIEPVTDTQFPWLALHSPHWGSTSFRNVCISGSPTIPDRISMSAHPALSGWVRYHLDTVGGTDGDWRFDKTLGPNGGIFARKKDEFTGTFQESLLRYHRPMLEDGAIEYEFEYQLGQSNVAPAIGHKAFLIEPDGVRRHLITDGVWDPSGLDPLNLSEPLSNIPCPLKAGWNRLRFALTGDTATITVNDVAVLKTQLTASDDRTFGLFHYADQTSVRVRNMFWSGEWPKTLPALRDQELRDQTIDAIDARLARLQDSVELNFATQGLQSKLKLTTVPVPFDSSFTSYRSSETGAGIFLDPAGFQMKRAATRQSNDVHLAMRFRAVGDFDIEAAFSDLKLTVGDNAGASIYLVVILDDDVTTHCRVNHGVYSHTDSDPRRVTQAEFNRFRKTGVDISYEGLATEACNSGRLRIARIGSRMHFLIAEEDSPTYRLLHSVDVSDVPVQLNGIRLVAGTYDNETPRTTSVQVVWKKLTMRADNLIPFPSLRFGSIGN